MKRSDRLKRVAEHFGDERDAASRQLVEKRAAMDEAENRLLDLRQYLASYHAELDSVRRTGTTSAKLQNYMNFLAQLQEALQQQELYTERARHAFDQQMEAWYRARSQVRAVERAAERHESAERQRDDRTEQRHLDDLPRYRLGGGEM